MHEFLYIILSVLEEQHVIAFHWCALKGIALCLGIHQYSTNNAGTSSSSCEM